MMAEDRGELTSSRRGQSGPTRQPMNMLTESSPEVGEDSNQPVGIKCGQRKIADRRPLPAGTETRRQRTAASEDGSQKPEDRGQRGQDNR